MDIIDEEWFLWFLILLIPLNIYGNIFLFAFSIIFFSAGVMRLLNWLHPPKEGIFEKGSKEWRYMHRRFWTAYLPIWLARVCPLPWLDIVCYRLFGTRIGKSVVAYEGYIDPNFVEIGDLAASRGMVLHFHITNEVFSSAEEQTLFKQRHLLMLMYAGYGAVVNSFWNTETSGQGASAGGSGKGTAEMQDITTFSGATWDIVAVANPDIRNLSYIWNIVDDETYPFLSWQP